jgi:hypothetical protein
MDRCGVDNFARKGGDKRKAELKRTDEGKT